MSIRNRLVLAFLLIALVPLVILSLAFITGTDRSLRTNIEAGLANIAAEKAATIEGVLKERILETRLLADHPELIAAVQAANAGYGGGDPLPEILRLDREWIAREGRSERADACLAHPLSRLLQAHQAKDPRRYGEILVTDRHGAVVAATRRLSDYYQGDEQWWSLLVAQGSGGLFIDDRGYDQTAGALVLGVEVPVERQQRVIGVLKINFRVGGILDVVAATRMAHRQRVRLARASGEVLAISPPPPGSPAGADVAPVPAGAGSAGEAVLLGVAPVTTPMFTRIPTDSARRGIRGERWEPTTWSVRVEVDRGEALAPVARFRVLALLTTLLTVALVAAVAWFIARSISRPIRILRRGTEIVGAGDLDYRISVENRDEIGDLARSFDAMTRRLKQVTASREELRREMAARRQAEAREARFGRILNSSSNEIYLFDADSLRFIEVNEGARRNLGYDQDELRELTPVDLKPDYTPERFAELVRPLRAGERDTVHFETRHRRKDGSSYPVEVRLQLFRHEEPPLFVAIILDISERQAARQALVEAGDRLRASNQELQEFAYVVSHDLQEPLRMVSSYLQLLKRRYLERLDRDAEEFIGFAVDGARRMSAMIDGLLQYSRVETQGAPFEPIEMAQALAEALANLRLGIEESGAEILQGPLPRVQADPGQMTRVWQNLVGNAIKFRGGGTPRIQVQAQRDGEHWVFSVRDNGIGMAAQDVGRIFTMFQRLHTQAEYPGMGIGLAVCRRILERHGGTLRAESAPGRGTTFLFTLPAGAGPA